MASLECIDADDLINGVDDVLKHNSFLLMSSLEETMQAEEYMCNNEELDNLIRTLEAEINPHTDTTEEHCDLPVEPRLLVDGHDCWPYINDLDIEWDEGWAKSGSGRVWVNPIEFRVVRVRQEPIRT